MHFEEIGKISNWNNLLNAHYNGMHWQKESFNSINPHRSLFKPVLIRFKNEMFFFSSPNSVYAASQPEDLQHSHIKITQFVTMAEQPIYKFYYFNLKALGEPIRVLFAYGCIKYEDIRIERSE